MADFRIEDINRTISQEARDAISDLILAWAAFDTAVSYWCGLAFGIDMDMMSILIGNMDTKTRLEKIKQACEHVGYTELAKSIKVLSSNHKKHADIRNIIAHRRCVGMIDIEGVPLVFTSTKHVHRNPGQFEMTIIALDQVKGATRFANHYAESIMKITEAYERQGPPQGQSEQPD